jgi:hypothetical protein
MRALSHAERAVVLQGFALVYCLMVCRGNAQNTATQDLSSSQKDQTRSFYVGGQVTHPEELSGIWEAADGHGGAIGLHLILSTTAPAEATTLVGAKQSWLDLQVGIYQRAGLVLQVGEENYFGDSPVGGSVRYANNRLTLHASGFDLDLRHVCGDEWSGRFHREGFDSEVSLIRPGNRGKTKKVSLAGAWKEGRWGPSQTCLHIVERAPGQLTGWSDTLLAWGAMRFAPNVPKPPYSLERYGDLAKVSATQNGVLLVELNAYTAICCSHLFAVTPSKNGTVMRANWTEGPNQASHKTEWRKMPGDTCIAPAP